MRDLFVFAVASAVLFASCQAKPDFNPEDPAVLAAIEGAHYSPNSSGRSDPRRTSERDLKYRTCDRAIDSDAVQQAANSQIM